MKLLIYLFAISSGEPSPEVVVDDRRPQSPYSEETGPFHACERAFRQKNYGDTMKTCREAYDDLPIEQRSSNLGSFPVRTSIDAYLRLEESAGGVAIATEITQNQLDLLNEYIGTVHRRGTTGEIDAQTWEEVLEMQTLLEQRLKPPLDEPPLDTQPNEPLLNEPPLDELSLGDPSLDESPLNEAQSSDPSDKPLRRLKSAGNSLVVLGSVSLLCGLASIGLRHGYGTALDHWDIREQGTEEYEGYRQIYGITGQVAYGALISSAVLLPVGLGLWTGRAIVTRRRKRRERALSFRARPSSRTRLHLVVEPSPSGMTLRF